MDFIDRNEYPMTSAEIAQELGCSRQSVTQTITSALWKVRMGLEARGYTRDDFRQWMAALDRRSSVWD